MSLIKSPVKPTWLPSLEGAIGFQSMPESWQSYLLDHRQVIGPAVVDFSHG